MRDPMNVRLPSMIPALSHTQSLIVKKNTKTVVKATTTLMIKETVQQLDKEHIVGKSGI